MEGGRAVRGSVWVCGLCAGKLGWGGAMVEAVSYGYGYIHIYVGLRGMGRGGALARRWRFPLV